ncbi:DUF1294 domain-containing protein [Citrobacter freundii]|nr:DUF1294 domain-containing protein [Citrobacter freundii]
MFLTRLCYLILFSAAMGCLWLPHPFVMWFLLVSVLTLAVYGIDKKAACNAWRRVPESTLLLLGAVGGWPGAILGQHFFRHKTKKQPFKTYFILTVMLNIVVLVVLYRLYPTLMV